MSLVRLPMFPVTDWEFFMLSTSLQRVANHPVQIMLLVLLLVAALLVPGSLAPAQGAPFKVIVEGEAGAAGTLQKAVELLGGTVLVDLPIINGLSAELPAGAVDALRAHPSVAAVTPDGTVRLMGKPDWPGKDDGGSGLPAPSGSGTTSFGDVSYTAELDGSLYHVVAEAIGADSYWESGYAGQGVTVALIDSGVVPVEGLLVDGKVINGPDLSFESQADHLRYLDTFGHGTHMAGIIAGRDSSFEPAAMYEADPAYFLGVAPEAAILNVKVADHDGAVDVSQVIAAIDWVVQHRNDNGMHVRVLNLSFGTDSTQSYVLDPLAHAVEQAVGHGIVVVVAAGNDGNVQPLRNPGLDPYVIAVGAVNTNGTKDIADDTLPDFSNCGTEDRHVDLVAPGVSIVSLRNPGSHADLTYPEAAVGERFFKGTGTSQAAAVVSGVAALVLSKKPNLSAYQVKNLLMKTARPIDGVHEWCQGAGLVDAKAAQKAKNAPGGVPPYTWSLGVGSLEAARGSYHVQDEGVLLTGEQDIFGMPFDSIRHALDATWGQAWDGGTWNGSSWSGAASWSGASWSGASWSGASWSGASWSSKSWSDNTWNGASWSGASWSGASWSGSSWSSRAWAGLSWR